MIFVLLFAHIITLGQACITQWSFAGGATTASGGPVTCANFGSEWPSLCIEHGSDPMWANYGLVANQACCACGGGKGAVSCCPLNTSGCVDLAAPEVPLQPEVSLASMSLYQATNGQGWTRRYGWGTACSYCQWYGVVCSEAGDVTKL